MNRQYVSAHLAVEQRRIDVAAQESVVERHRGPVRRRPRIRRPAQLVPGVPYHHMRRTAQSPVAVVLQGRNKMLEGMSNLCSHARKPWIGRSAEKSVPCHHVRRAALVPSSCCRGQGYSAVTELFPK